MFVKLEEYSCCCEHDHGDLVNAADKYSTGGNGAGV